jgi:hypothetical protein
VGRPKVEDERRPEFGRSELCFDFRQREGGKIRGPADTEHLSCVIDQNKSLGAARPQSSSGTQSVGGRLIIILVTYNQVGQMRIIQALKRRAIIARRPVMPALPTVETDLSGVSALRKIYRQHAGI